MFGCRTDRERPSGGVLAVSIGDVRNVGCSDSRAVRVLL